VSGEQAKKFVIGVDGLAILVGEEEGVWVLLVEPFCVGVRGGFVLLFDLFAVDLFKVFLFDFLVVLFFFRLFWVLFSLLSLIFFVIVVSAPLGVWRRSLRALVIKKPGVL
jgi:hypothetical protein